MAIVPDFRLREIGATLIDPFDPEMVQPASIDVHLDRYFYRAQTVDPTYVIDPVKSNDDCFEELFEVPEGETFLMNPKDFVLASTVQKLTVPTNMMARFEGKSSLGRIGLLTHITAGFIDPGFSGFITLELKNVTNFGIVLHPGMKIGQICFEDLSASVEFPYGSSENGSHYQDQVGPTLSKIDQNFNKINVYATPEEGE